MESQPYKVLVWNVRGLNSPARRSAVYQVVDMIRPGIVCLQEKKVEHLTVDVVRHYL